MQTCKQEYLNIKTAVKLGILSINDAAIKLKTLQENLFKRRKYHVCSIQPL